jgi:hypothetical protein
MLIDAEGSRLEEYEEGLHLPHDNPSERFFALLGNVRLVNALYGVSRTQILKRTRLLGAFRGSDITFLAELCLHGKIIELPEPLMLRRMHEESFTSMTPEEQLEFNNPGQAQTVEMYFWRHLFEHVRSILRAPLNARERVRLLSGLSRQMVSARYAYLAELLAAARSFGRGRA